MVFAESVHGALLPEGLANGLRVGDGETENGRHDLTESTGSAEELCEAVTTLARVFYARTVVGEVPAPSWWRFMLPRGQRGNAQVARPACLSRPCPRRSWTPFPRYRGAPTDNVW